MDCVMIWTSCRPERLATCLPAISPTYEHINSPTTTPPFASLTSTICTPDRSRRLERWRRLRPLVEAKLAQYRDVTALKKSGQDDKALQLANGDGRTPIIDQIRSIVAEMQIDEDETLADRKRANENKLDTSDAVSTGLLVLSATVVIYAGVLILRIRQLRSIITICAWTQKVNFNGKWMAMEEFLWRRFRVKVSHGISEEAFDGVIGMVGKNLKVSDSRSNRLDTPTAQPDVEKGR